MYQNQEIGKIGEEIAFTYLINQGYSILERNFSCRFGEMDIIAKAKSNNAIIFIEVKTRTQLAYGRPAEAIDRRKLKHLYYVANYFLVKNHFENNPIRFDVIEILQSKNINKENRKTKIHHIQNILYDNPIQTVTYFSTFSKN